MVVPCEGKFFHAIKEEAEKESEEIAGSDDLIQYVKGGTMPMKHMNMPHMSP